MKNLIEVKDSYAMADGYQNFDDMIESNSDASYNMEGWMDEVAELYAKERVNAALEEAANNARVVWVVDINGRGVQAVDRDSILSLKIEV